MDKAHQSSFEVRRVVTGHDKSGKAVVVADGPAPHVFELREGLHFAELWSTSETPVVIDTGTDPTAGPLTLKPPTHGSVFRIVSHPPEGDAGAIDVRDARRIFASMGAADSAIATAQSPHPTMHRTQTVDYAIVLRGRIRLVLDDGEVDLSEGDVVIQRGTNHAWVNRSSEPCLMAFILLDGRFSAKMTGTAETTT